MRDEVDDLVEAWARERGDLDLAPVEIFSRISRLARHLDLARREAFTAHDVESWEFDVLAALRRAGKPYQLSPGRLLRETLVTSGTMTNRVDRLDRARLRRAARRPRRPARRHRAPHPRGQEGRRRRVRGPARRREPAALRPVRPGPHQARRAAPPAARAVRGLIRAALRVAVWSPTATKPAPELRFLTNRHPPARPPAPGTTCGLVTNRNQTGPGAAVPDQSTPRRDDTRPGAPSTTAVGDQTAAPERSPPERYSSPSAASSHSVSSASRSAERAAASAERAASRS